MTPLLAFFLFSLGSVSGILSSFFGISGGIFIVPILYLLFPYFPPSVIATTSLAFIFIVTMINNINFYKAGKKPNLYLAGILGGCLAIGSLSGSLLNSYCSPQTLKFVLFAFLIFVALKTLLNQTHKGDVTQCSWIPQLNKKLLLKTISFSIVGGIISGMTGVGGGTILVPLMISVLGTPFNCVPLYTNFAVSIGTAVGVLTYLFTGPEQTAVLSGTLGMFQWKSLNILVVFLIGAGAFTTSSLGMSLSRRLPEHITRRAFTTLILMLSTNLLISALVG